MPAWIARAGPATAPVFRFDCGSGHSFRAETAWLFASPPAMRAPADSHPSLRSGLLRSASRRHLRATALCPRSRPPLAIRRPSTTIRQDRSRSQALRSRHRRPCRAPADTDSFLHSRPVTFAPLPHLRAVRSRSTPSMTLRRRWGCRCSLSLHRSRIRSEHSLSPVGCLIVAPAPASGRRRERLRPSAPQGIARCAALHLARRC